MVLPQVGGGAAGAGSVLAGRRCVALTRCRTAVPCVPLPGSERRSRSGDRPSDRGRHRLRATEDRADPLGRIGKDVEDLLACRVVRDAAYRIPHLETERVDGGLDVARGSRCAAAAISSRGAGPLPLVGRACRCRVGACLLGRLLQLGAQIRGAAVDALTYPVSYTHLTLPTNREV